MKLTRVGLLCCALWHMACSDDGGRGNLVIPPDDAADPTNPSTIGPGNPGTAGSGGVAPGGALLQVDDRPPVIAEVVPPPISGGTLLVTRDGLTAVAADPDRDRVSFVDLRSDAVLGHVALEAGDEPGRLAQDGDGRIHVALRGSGALATIDLAERSLLARREVCGAPRGVAYDADGDVIHVACASGRLVTLQASGGDALRDVRVGADLRDVVVQGERLLVSQFKSATVLALDGSAEVTDEYRPRSVTQLVALGDEARGLGTLPFGNGVPFGKPRGFAPSLARRTIALDGSRALVLHERSMTDEVPIEDPHDPMDMPGPGDEVGDPGAGGYGSGESCQSIVQTAVSIVDADGTVLQSSSIAGAVLAVDLAISSDGTTIAVASAGTRDFGAPQRGGFGIPAPGFAPGFAPLPPSEFDAMGGFAATNGLAARGSISFINVGEPVFHDGGDLGSNCVFNTLPIGGQPTAVAYTEDGTLVIQSREPAALMLLSASGLRVIDLGGESRLDTGHELFHRDAGGGIACASCHGEGGDDGHVWLFSGLGARRTQSINVGLRGTAPFHWSGDMRDLSTLMGEVFVNRMGGVPQSPARMEAFTGWLFAQQPLPAMRAADDPAAVRGKRLFESKEVGCANCHNGEKLTNNLSVDVGTGGVFQVPSLVGIAYRAPFIHDGCAATLRDRFDPSCGGDDHGRIEHLGDADIDDLVAYLETL